MDKKKNFQEKLEAFKKAAFELSEAWDQIGGEMEIGCKKYPFVYSFDEIIGDIAAWTTATIADLQERE